MPAGRPTLYKDEYPEKMVAFFNVDKTQKVTLERTKKYNKDGTLIQDTEKYKIIPNDLPTFEAFARSIDVSDRTLENWYNAVVDSEADEPERKHPEFFRAYNRCKGLQKEFLVDNGLQGNSPPATTIFVLKNVTDMTDKQVIETNDKDYKEKQDALSKFFNTLRHNNQPEPTGSRTDETTSPSI